jgi:hypothetical protein
MRIKSRSIVACAVSGEISLLQEGIGSIWMPSELVKFGCCHIILSNFQGLNIVYCPSKPGEVKH